MLSLSVALGSVSMSAPLGGVSLAVLTVDPNVTYNHLTGVYTFTINRTGNTTGTTVGNWSVGPTALSGRTPTTAADFGTYPSGTVTFNPGDTTKTVTFSAAATANVSPE